MHSKMWQLKSSFVLNSLKFSPLFIWQWFRLDVLSTTGDKNEHSHTHTDTHTSAQALEQHFASHRGIWLNTAPCTPVQMHVITHCAASLDRKKCSRLPGTLSSFACANLEHIKTVQRTTIESQHNTVEASRNHPFPYALGLGMPVWQLKWLQQKRNDHAPEASAFLPNRSPRTFTFRALQFCPRSAAPRPAI